MGRYVAFLRGMNLGGRRIANEALRGHFEALGYDVPVFLRSARELRALAAHEPFEAKLLAASTRTASPSRRASCTGSPTAASPNPSWTYFPPG